MAQVLRLMRLAARGVHLWDWDQMEKTHISFVLVVERVGKIFPGFGRGCSGDAVFAVLLAIFDHLFEITESAVV